MSKFNIEYIAYDSNKVLTVAISDIRYDYYDINIYQVNKVKSLIKYKNYKEAIRILKKYKHSREHKVVSDVLKPMSNAERKLLKDILNDYYSLEI